MALSRSDLEKIKRFSSIAEVIAYANEQGIQCTEEQAVALLKVANSGRVEDALQEASGTLGCCFLLCPHNYIPNLPT